MQAGARFAIPQVRNHPPPASIVLLLGPGATASARTICTNSARKSGAGWKVPFPALRVWTAPMAGILVAAVRRVPPEATVGSPERRSLPRPLPRSNGLVPASTAAAKSPATATRRRAATHAFLSGGGTITDLKSRLDSTSSGRTITFAEGINDSGQIIANGHDAVGNYRAVRLDPISTPDPGSTLFLLGMSLAGLGAARRRLC